MLGSRSEADDAVQDAWLRLSRSDTSGVANLGGWLTTVVARVCLDMLHSRAARREDSLSTHAPDSIASHTGETEFEDEAVLTDSVGLALLVVLETLTPAERVAFVLHDIFDLPFDEIVTPRGRLRIALDFTIRNGKIVAIDVVADPERLRQLDVGVLDAR